MTRITLSKKSLYFSAGAALMLSLILFTNAGFVIQTNIASGIQYMKKIILVGADGTTTGVILDGNGSSFFSGKVGIGTTSPSEKFHVSAGNIIVDTSKAFGRGDRTAQIVGVTGSNGYMRFDTNNVEKVRIDGSGNVGIGTTNPQALLDLASTNTSTERIRLSGREFYDSGFTSTGGVSLLLGVNRDFNNKQLWIGNSSYLTKNSINTIIRFSNFGTGTTPRIDAIATDGETPKTLGLGTNGAVSITPSGNVGIGTATPDATTSTTIYKTITSADYLRGQLALYTDNSMRMYIGVNTDDNAFLQAHKSAVGYKNILLNPAGGNVGIGTTSPGSKLEVQEADGSKRAISSFGNTNRDRRLEIVQDIGGDPTSYIGLNARENASSNGRDFVLQTAGTERMRIKYTDGNVGIGTTPTTKLHVYNNANSVADILTLHNDNSAVGVNGSSILFKGYYKNALIRGYGNPQSNQGGWLQLTTYNTDPVVNNGILVDTVGNVGINNLTPAYSLDVNGYIRGTNVAVSDQRYKKNIETLINPLDKLLQLRGVTFDFRTSEFPQKNFNTGTQIGVIAQEVEKIYPELVSTDNEGYKSVSYANFAPILIEAIKAQQQQIENQKQDIELLKQQVLQLQNK